MYDMLPTCWSYLSPREVLITSINEEGTEAQTSVRPPCLPSFPLHNPGSQPQAEPPLPSPPGSPVCRAETLSPVS